MERSVESRIFAEHLAQARRRPEEDRVAEVGLQIVGVIQSRITREHQAFPWFQRSQGTLDERRTHPLSGHAQMHDCLLLTSRS